MWVEFHISNCESLVRSKMGRDFTKMDSSQLPFPISSSNDILTDLPYVSPPSRPRSLGEKVDRRILQGIMFII